MGYFKSNSLEVPITVLNIQPYSPLFDKVTVKVMYAGLNRNGSYFTKEAVEQLAKSLPNTPLVGSFDRSIKDFKGHEQTIGFDENNKLKMVSSTVPYGVVPADSKIWWQWFDDGGTKREYLCCEALLWTKRFPEIRETIVAGTSNQSMEIDEDTLVGAWAMDSNSGQKFFYVKESYLLGLCILGQKTQPCFQGATLSKPVSYSAKAEKENFNSMLEELKVALNYEISKKSEGSKKMDTTILENAVEDTTTPVERPAAAETEEAIITDANFALVDEFGNPIQEQPQPQADPHMQEMLLQKKLEVAAQTAELAVLEDFVEGQGGGVQGNPQDPTALPEDEMARKKREEEEGVIVEPDQPTEEPLDNPLEDTVPRPGLEPQKRIDDARERSEGEVPTEPEKEEPPAPAQPEPKEEPTPAVPVEEDEEEKKKKKPPFLKNEVDDSLDFEAERAKFQNDISEAYAYIKQLEMELEPLRQFKSKADLQEKMNLLHEFKETYENIETTFTEEVLNSQTLDQLKSSLGLYAFEHRAEAKTVVVEKEPEAPIVTFAAKDDNRPSFIKALDAALGRGVK